MRTRRAPGNRTGVREMSESTQQRRPALLSCLRASQRGEGVISAAIAVLVMAFLGVAMWGAFNLIFDDAQERVHDNVREIGEG